MSAPVIAPAQSPEAHAPGSTQSMHSGSRVGQAVDGVLGNVLTIAKFSGSTLVQDDLVGTLMAVRDMVKTAQSGDLSQPEAILMAQALALDAIFGNLAKRAAGSLASDLDRSDRLLRLALRAQAQSRASLETLIVAKNPPVVIARQANIASGHQQVNNGTDSGPANGEAFVKEARAKNSESAPNEVLEEAAHVERMDAGASPETVGRNKDVAAMEQRHRPAHSRRQGAELAKRRSR